jgi:hypothetical protein
MGHFVKQVAGAEFLDLAEQPCDYITLRLNGRANGSN